VTGSYIRLAIDKDLTLQSILCHRYSRGTPAVIPHSFEHRQVRLGTSSCRRCQGTVTCSLVPEMEAEMHLTHLKAARSGRVKS